MTWYNLQKFLKCFFRSFFPLSVAIFFFKKGFPLQSGLKIFVAIRIIGHCEEHSDEAISKVFNNKIFTHFVILQESQQLKNKIMV